MAKSKEYELAIKIAGEIEKSFYNTTKLTKKELAAIAREASKASGMIESSFSQSFQKELNTIAPIFSSMENSAKVAFHAIATGAATAATAITAVAAASISVGTEFESAFAGVKKTTDATAAEYEELRKGIIEMSTNDLPASASAIAEVAEAAGQLGIAKENLLSFSRVMIDLGESTNLSSDEAASSLAKFANITNMSADKYSNLGSVIVDLGNNFATTEADIVSMATRLASSGSLVGLSEAQIMGIATAMSSVGIEAEAGGSAMSKLLKQMQVAAELGGDSLKAYASVAGMSGKEFKQAFEEDAVVAMGKFITGLNDTKRNGKSAIAILDEMDLTEIRLSNTILSLANANGVMENAIVTANNAWKENTALTNEVNQRYDTTESKVEMLKNKVSAIGIEVYDNLRTPYRDLIAFASDAVTGLYENLGESNFIGDMAANLSKQIPTAVRKLKELGGAVADFSEPFLDVGEWLLDNPGVIVGTIAGIGTAIATYKVASGITSMVTALGSLGPVGWTILAIGGVVGVIAGIGSAVKKSALEAKKANLAEHFGNISLSLEELQEVAEHIIATDSLGEVREAIAALGELDEVQRAIDDSISAINKMNWKVSIGMELSVDEQEEYKNEIASYIENCQQYISDQQYAVNLAVGVLTDDDLEGSNIVAQINEFYANKQGELSDLGTQLNNTITEAFNDGLLDMDEVEEITQLQQQMARIQSEVAGSNFESNMELLKIKYGGDLDAPSFQNLQAEIKEQMDTAIADYDESFTLSMANAKIMLDDGTINLSDYESMINEYKENYLEQIGEIQSQAASFQYNTITSQYSKELSGMSDFIKEYQDYTKQMEMVFSSDTYKESWATNSAGTWEMLLAPIKEMSDLTDTEKKALNELYQGMESTLDEMILLKQKYLEAGLEVPAEVTKQIQDISTLGAMAGNEDAMWQMFENSMEDNEAYQELVKKLDNDGQYLPEAVSQGIRNNKIMIQDAIMDCYGETEEGLLKTFNKGFDVHTNVRLYINSNYANLTSNNPLANISNPATIANNVKELTGHATGGIFNTPHIAWFAEDGPEAAIPLDGSQNAINLWEETGKLLGINGFSNDAGESFSSMADKLSAQAPENVGGGISNEGNVNFSYSPTLQFYGDAPSKKDLDESLLMSQERFEKMMKQYIKDNGRISFA